MNSDDRAGLEIAKELDRIIAKKTGQSPVALVLFGILAGAYIGFGAVAATTVTAFDGLPIAVSKFLAGTVFCVGLVLVIIPGSELFTGNILLAAGIVDRKVGFIRVLRNWGFAYVGNFAGAVLLALLVYGSGLLGTPEHPTPVGAAAAKVADAKIALPFVQALLRGILCNILVCLAVIMAVSSRTMFGKILGIYFPIMVFVLSGYEHSIANMYFLPAGLLAEGRFLSGFGSMFTNLVPVTLGNIAGGLLVVVLHPARARRLARLFRHTRPEGPPAEGK
ncbi:MAG: formate/nitrite transporter family protein [Phycisphaerae bacterium]|nr:formate/nitrite transporter family protein [Phycisphaerae bacterium]